MTDSATPAAVPVTYFSFRGCDGHGARIHARRQALTSARIAHRRNRAVGRGLGHRLRHLRKTHGVAALGGTATPSEKGHYVPHAFLHVRGPSMMARSHRCLDRKCGD